MKNWFAVALLLAPVGAAGAVPSLAQGPSDSSEPTPQAPLASNEAPVLTVIETDMRSFLVTFRPNVRETRVVIGGRTYDSLSLPGAVAPAVPGAPSVPFLARPFAVPAGAEVTTRVVSLTTTRRLNRWLRPTTPNWEDDETGPEAPVVENPAYYGSSAPYPAGFATVRTGGPTLAGTPSGVLQLSAARFSPSARTLDIVREMTVEVTFDRAFAARPLIQGRADIHFSGNFLNRAIVDVGLPNVIWGSPELLIITDELLKPAADRLAAWKEQKGIDTWVVTTAGIGTDAASIKSYIQARYDAPDSNLAYVLLLGAVDTIPTNYLPTSEEAATGAPSSLASDLPYAQLDASGDVRPDVAYGRISVDVIGDAEDVVDKILDYEMTPSFDTATYRSLAFAGYFQDDVRQATLNVNGVLLESRANGGNGISLAILNPPNRPASLPVPGPYFPGLPISVTVNSQAIRVTLGSDANGYINSSWRAVKVAINNSAAAVALVIASEDVDIDDDGTDEFVITALAQARAVQFLSGGMVRDGIADKPYIDVLEEIRTVLLGHGKTVDRFYTTNSLPEVATGPLTFEDGSPLPGELLLANGFGWDADAADIQAAFNAGRAIVWHRDHGSRDGWADPGFGKSDVAALDNGDVDPADAYEDRLPVVFSINCSSGKFDDVFESHAEELLREADGGAVAVVAASRDSSTSRNQVLSRGLFDGLWDDVLAAFDPTMASTSLPATLRLGDLLNYAKDWVLTSYPDPTDAYTIDQIEMYHLHGDPTLEVWKARPKTLTPTLVWLEPTPGDFVLQVEVHADIGQQHLALWDANRQVATATFIRATPVLNGASTRVYELDYPDRAVGDITMYLTQPAYRPYVAVVQP